jgi:microcompartment protein CcmL/EutN
MSSPTTTGHPALGILELASIARGAVVADALVKRAEVEILWSRPVSSGKHLVAWVGPVAEVEESYAAGRAVAAELCVDELYLPFADRQILPLLVDAGPKLPTAEGSVAVVETTTVCAAVAGADAAAKATAVAVARLHLATGIGGKAYFVLRGELYDIEAAVVAARAAIAGARLINLEIIAAPHPDAPR